MPDPDAFLLPNRTEPNRVALFTGAYNHIADGVSRTLNRLVAHLESLSFEVRVFAPTIPEPQVRHAGTMIEVPSVATPGRPDYRLSFGLTPAVRSRLEAFSPDLYHIATPDILGLQALLHARKKGKPVVASYHTHFPSYLQYYRLNFLEPLVWRYARWFYAQCRHVYVPSQSMQDVLYENGIRNNVLLWERGVDTNLFSPERRSNSWRSDHGFADDDIVITFVSRLVWEKGLLRMVEVLNRLQEKGAPFRILIVGDGPSRDELMSMLPGAVFTGYLEGEELATAYASSDVFLFPSDTETFGNATLEAMASGLPTVCALATGNATLVEDGRTGYLVPASDTDVFAQRLYGLLSDHSLRSQMGRSAREAALAYDWRAVLNRITGYYMDVLAPGSRVAERPEAHDSSHSTELMTL